MRLIAAIAGSFLVCGTAFAQDAASDPKAALDRCTGQMGIAGGYIQADEQRILALGTALNAANEQIASLKKELEDEKKAHTPKPPK